MFRRVCILEQVLWETQEAETVDLQTSTGAEARSLIHCALIQR